VTNVLKMTNAQRHQWGRDKLDEILASEDPVALANSMDGMSYAELQVLALVSTARLWIREHPNG
jgi:hypothetical protein